MSFVFYRKCDSDDDQMDDDGDIIWRRMISDDVNDVDDIDVDAGADDDNVVTVTDFRSDVATAVVDATAGRRFDLGLINTTRVRGRDGLIRVTPIKSWKSGMCWSMWVHSADQKI